MQVTPEAREKLRDFLEDYGDGFVRVGRLATGGACCAKLTLGVTLDEDKDEENDLAFSIDGLPVVIDKALHDSLTEVLVAYDPEKGIVVSAG